jgi:lysylphosphatidylglycerol synthetase-like protein (DUF2156 family)
MSARSRSRPWRESSMRTVGADVRLGLLRQHGNFALAYSAAFQAEMDYFGDQRGFLAYKRIGATALVLSDPIAPLGKCDDLICRFMHENGDVCFWQASRPVAEILESHGFSVNEMGVETRIELNGYDFDGPRKRNFRRALNRAAAFGYVTAERSVASLNRQELRTVSERWRQTRRVKNREMTFLTRPVVLDDEIDVRKFFTFDREGRLQAFAFFDPMYEDGDVVGYLCSAKRRLPEADVLVGYAILHRAICTFQNEGKRFLSLGLSPLCGIEDKDLAGNRLVGFGLRLVYRSPLFNKFVYPLRGFAAHKGAFCGSAEQTYYAFNRRPSLPRLLKILRACNLV